MSLSFNGHVKAAPALRPLLNVGCLMDIPCGRYHKGKHGEWILNGGQALLTGVGGRGNTYKSTLAHHLNLTILNRYMQSHENVYDTEMSFSATRANDLTWSMENIAGRDLVEDGRLLITDSTVSNGEVWFDEIKKFGDHKQKEYKAFGGKTPFINKDGSHVEYYYPSLAFVDSFSRMNFSSLDAIYEKNAVGEAGMNMEATRASHAKNQLLIQTPILTASSGIYMTFTAHVDDSVSLDPYAPVQKKLGFLKNGLKFKYVPSQFTFLMNNLWYCYDAAPLMNQTTKAAEFPRNSDDNDPDNKDLMLITVQNMRGKYGPSGTPFHLIASQSEGIKVGLSEFFYIREYDRFGLGGNVQNYYLELLPDVKLSRTTIRGKIDENKQLQRALEITSELCQLKNLFPRMFDTLIEWRTPKEIYECLTAKGYDWEILLGQTRGYWIYEGTPNPLHFLSTLDLLEMCKSENAYRPWWYDEVASKKIADAALKKASVSKTKTSEPA